MSRIRSIHPGLWTDERFVTASPMARLFFMGLWNECDDYGSFEWSPLKLKMRLLPADNADAAELLAELESAGSLIRYEVAGKAYGAVRNFCQYQRPKKPNSTYPQTDEIRDWVNIEARSARDGSEEVPNELPTGGEKPRQMKDGGGKKDSSVDKSTGASPPSDDPVKQVFDLGVSILTSTGNTEKHARSLIGKWSKGGKESEVLQALIIARGKANPVEWLNARFKSAKFVSSSGYEYRGSLQQIIREAEKRGDNNTYWSAKSALESEKRATA